MVTSEGILEIKNIAIAPRHRGKGYGRRMIEFVAAKYSGKFDKIILGTGDSPLTVIFYEKCGFGYTHRIKDFFTDNYDHPIYEEGVLLTDMVYFERII